MAVTLASTSLVPSLRTYWPPRVSGRWPSQKRLALISAAAMAGSPVPMTSPRSTKSSSARVRPTASPLRARWTSLAPNRSMEATRLRLPDGDSETVSPRRRVPVSTRPT
jgi:hypothetical protein